jgi:hypothetical protein
LIERNHLESWVPIEKARKLVDEFIDDRVTYPDYEFYSHKRGINKDILEEFRPLLLFSESLSSATSIRLSPESLPGPDGAILLKDGTEIAVQITLSHERNDGYKERLTLRDNSQLSKRGLTINGDIAERLARIIEAIKDKEANFRAGTEVLLVVDDSTKWVPGLPNELEEAIVSLPPSKYSATYIIFREDVRQVR